MKISYILQLKEFTIMFAIGILIGIFYGIISIPYKIKKYIAFKIGIDFIISIVTTIVFITAINIQNQGKIRVFLIIAYLLGILIERITLGKIFAKGYKFVYNKLVIVNKQFKNSKVGKVIFK